MSVRRVAAIVLVALVVWWYVLLPPAPVSLPMPADSRPAVRGAIHVHTRRSDGTGTVDTIASAAQRAGLRFVILTDHGDATRRPEAPAYIDKVLCIDAVEISTEGGHLVALDLPQAPYPLGGEPRDVIEDVHRLGGMAIAAHPESMKPALRWQDWNSPVDGLEWLNADSEWRDEPALTLTRVLFAYPARGAAALAMLLNRPDDVFKRWDALAAQRPIVAIAAADAHARLGWRPSTDLTTRGIALPLPSYEQLFRTFSVSLPDVQLSGDAAVDARRVIDAIKHGHLFSSVDALAQPASLSFTARSGTRSASGGDVLPVEGPVSLRVSTALPGGGEIRLFRNGMIVATSQQAVLDYGDAAAGAYRVEVRLPGQRRDESRAPWIVANPIYVGMPPRSTTSSLPSQEQTSTVQYQDGPSVGWEVEHSGRSDGAIDVVKALAGSELLVRYALSGSIDDAAFVAATVRPSVDLTSFDRVTFVGRADRPMRLSVQLRTSQDGGAERWQRSVYLDRAPRAISVRFDDMTPVQPAVTPHPTPAKIQSVLFVVDTVNTRQGSSGQFWLDDIAYAR